jgi:hypothetical protein
MRVSPRELPWAASPLRSRPMGPDMLIFGKFSDNLTSAQRFMIGTHYIEEAFTCHNFPLHSHVKARQHRYGHGLG